MSYEPNDRVQLARIVTNPLFDGVTRPVWDCLSSSQSHTLNIPGIEYTECLCGDIVIRMIRFSNCGRYGLDPDQVVALRLSEMPV